ncbi:MAG: 2'-5' RNA ligase [Comamonadaceae bacterium]|nr:MAG: 2'-5' RNA ligase [Comamonadaceae bacterium]
MSAHAPLAPPTQRLFLALWPDDRIRVQIAAHADDWRWPHECARYSPQDWHVTLHFLGNVDADRVPDIATAADLPCPPFELVLDQPQLWPRGLAVLCTTQLPPELRALHARLGQALRGLGLPLETRPYQAHVTLARHAAAASPPAVAAPVVWPVRGFALVASSRDKAQRYRVLRQYGG